MIQHVRGATLCGKTNSWQWTSNSHSDEKHQLAAQELQANCCEPIADTHFGLIFSLADTAPFNFSNFANRSRTRSASGAFGTNSR